ncbi:autotransporter domain-containing protein [Phaeovibrio sulfidiphilus]|uniref:Autotransporter domain-containing protein n=1 Tax=Phaeovibrio sulfidiphilus TaxID=1220600 RepID=A0A8J6YHE7_9PROT|nr:autotransporter domain-containing protein [Phaeovibrio sulfidiphilus]MBE1236351.1 autotransporter domain-containing protein [Phaeovibrio sulfidiphilus]
MTASHTIPFAPPAQAGGRRRGLALTGVALALALTATGAAPAHARVPKCTGGTCTIDSDVTWEYLLDHSDFTPKVLSGLTFKGGMLTFDDDTVLKATEGTADQKLTVAAGEKATIAVAEGKTLTISGNAVPFAAADEDANPGGAVYNEGTLNLGRENGGSLIFAGNVHKNLMASGGAIFNTGDLTVSGSDATFRDNVAQGSTQPDSYVAGGAILNTGTLNFNSVTLFEGNTATGFGADGGAIANREAGGDIQVYSGGGSSGITASRHLIFSKNVASGVGAFGGAISNWGTVTLAGGGTFIENRAEAQAGAEGATGAGGAIANAGTLEVGGVSTFLKNTATTFGGAIFNGCNRSTVTFSAPVDFTQNSAGAGGAIYNEGDTSTKVSFDEKSYATFTANTATNGHGGAIYNKGGMVSILGSASFEGNTATGHGGAIYTTGGMVDLSPENAGQSIKFSGNLMGEGGGAANSIYLDATTASTRLDVAGYGDVVMSDPMAGRAADGQAIHIAKSGAGTWTLGGVSTFGSEGTGGTRFAVTEGALAFGSSNTQLTLKGEDSSFLLLADTALAVNASGAAITVGNGTGNLADGKITLADGATLAFDLTKHAGAPGEPMLTLKAGIVEARYSVVTINVTDFKSPDGGSSPKTYTLLSVNSGGEDVVFAGNSFNYQYRGEAVVPGSGNRIAALLVFGSDNSPANVTVHAPENAELTWAGELGGRWGINDAVWKDSLNSEKTFLPGDVVTFELTTEGVINVNPGGVEVAAMTVSGTGTPAFIGGRIQSTDRSSFKDGGATQELKILDGASAIFDIDELNFKGGYRIGNGARMDFGGESLVGDVFNLGTLAFANASDARYSGVLSGTGGILKYEAGTLYLSGAHTATGDFSLLNGALGGDFSYAGTLKLAAEGTILAPGTATSVGTMTVNKLVTDDKKFTLQVRVAPEAETQASQHQLASYSGPSTANGSSTVTNDRLVVLTENVTIPTGSALEVGTVGGSGWSTNKTYVVLTAKEGTISGTFGNNITKAADRPFLSVAQVLLDANNTETTDPSRVKSIGLVAAFSGPSTDPVDPPVDPVDPPVDPVTPPVNPSKPDPVKPIPPKPAPSPWDGASPNQRSVGQAVASMRGGPVQDALINASRSEGLQILSMLSGDAYANVAGALRQGAPQLSRTVLNTLSHLAPSRDGIVGGGRVQVASTEQVSLTPSDGQLRNHNVWAQVSGSHDSWDSDGNAAKSTSSGIGVTAGASFGFEDGWFTGAVFRYAHRDFKVSDRAAKADIDSFSGGVYGGKVWDAGVGTLRTTLAGLYTRHEVDSKRSVIGERLSADYGADVFQVFGEAAWRVQANDWLMVEPFVGAAWNMAHSEDFSETGGAAALRSHSWTTHTGTSTLGVRMDARVHECAVLKLDLGWEHTWGDINPASRLAFVSGSTDFSVRGTPADRDVAVVGVGGEVAIDDAWALNLMYDGAYGSDTTSHGGRARLTYRW